MVASQSSSVGLSNAAQAVLVRLILVAIPSINVMVEQPSGSWGYKQWFMEILLEDFSLFLDSKVFHELTKL